MSNKTPDFADLIQRLSECVENPEAIEGSMKEWVGENEEAFASDVNPDGTTVEDW